MNNYRNYGNYGNRRYNGSMDDCACAGKTMPNHMHRMLENDCGGRKENVMQGADCGCKKEDVMRGTDCGGKKDGVMKGMDCGCKKEEIMGGNDCGCHDKHEENCDCSIESMYREVKKNGVCCDEDMPGKALAMAYVPWQTWRKLYDVCEGFSTGTIFRELNLEFYGRRCN